MRVRFHIYYQTVLLLMMAAVLLTACSSESSEAPTVPADKGSTDHVLHLLSFASSYEELVSSHRAAPTGYSAYPLDKVTEMGIYMVLPADYTAPNVPTEQRIKYDGAKWHAYFSVDKDKTYSVYGYLPKATGMSSSLSKSTADADAATLTITGMKAVTTDDICVITGAKETETGLKEGSFSWYQAVTNDDYYIYMLLNHLYASVRFSMKVDADYAQLRTIKLKSMTLSTNQGSVNATISLTHNTTGASPISNVTYTASGDNDAVVIFNSDEGTALSQTTATIVNAYFAPTSTLSSNLTLVSTYDLYDSKGNLIREGCTATNKIPDLEASRGQRVQLNLTVNPTYLYVLSDPDLDNPTITIN